MCQCVLSPVGNALYISLKVHIVIRGPFVSYQGTTEVPKGLDGGRWLSVVLGISEVLCCVRTPESGQHKNIFCNLGASTIFRGGNYLFLQAGVFKFLHKLFEHFEVIFWSTLNSEITIEVCNILLGEDLKPITILCQVNCMVILGTDGLPILDPERRDKPLLLQVLCATVWDNPLLPLCLKWQPSKGNTLLITNWLVRGILNPPHSSIYIPCFQSIYKCSIILEDIIFPWLMKWKESNI